MTDYLWVRNDRGDEYAVVASAFDPEIHEQVDGAVVDLDSFGRPTLRKDESTTPTQSASKASWVEYAVSQGMSPEEAEATTKADLIATYGKEN